VCAHAARERQRPVSLLGANLWRWAASGRQICLARPLGRPQRRPREGLVFGRQRAVHVQISGKPSPPGPAIGSGNLDTPLARMHLDRAAGGQLQINSASAGTTIHALLSIDQALPVRRSPLVPLTGPADSTSSRELLLSAP
jgi:hypothetical protein